MNRLFIPLLLYNSVFILPASFYSINTYTKIFYVYFMLFQRSKWGIYYSVCKSIPFNLFLMRKLLTIADQWPD